MALERITIPALVVHHKQDGCGLGVRRSAAPDGAAHDGTRHGTPAVDGGTTQGDPCQAFAYRGFNGRERGVVSQIAAWIVTH